MGDVGEIHVRMGCPLFVEKVLQNRFGIDVHGFFAKDAVEDVEAVQYAKRVSGTIQ